jgi:Domain of unknown function (DUF222)
MFDAPPGAGPELARLVADASPAGLDDDALIDAIAAWERLAGWVAAGQLSAIAEFAQRRPSQGAGGDSGHPGLPAVSEFAVDELAAVLRLSRAAAAMRLQLAVELAERLPGTAAALRAGELDVPRARAVVEATSPLEPQVAAAVEARVLPRAGRQTVGQLRGSLARAVLVADSAGVEERHERARAKRRVIVTPLPDGMAELWALLPAEGAATVRAALDDAARRPAAPGDNRTADARRADALVDLAAGAIGPAASSRPAEGNGKPARPLVHVTVPAGVLLGRDGVPAELAGYGPIPASIARRLAADGTWRRILTDPASGALLDVGRASYTPPRRLAEHVSIRDGTCRFPGCRQPARRCDLDHVRPYPAGPTSADNLVALCRHHHRLKHRSGWEVRQHEDGTLTWTSPTGHRYRTRPAQLPTAQQAPRAGRTRAGTRQRTRRAKWPRASTGRPAWRRPGVFVGFRMAAVKSSQIRPAKRRQPSPGGPAR